MQNLQWKSSAPKAIGALLLGTFVAHQPGVTATSSLDAQDKKVAARVEKIIRENVTSPNNSLKLVVKPTARADQGYFSEIAIEGQPAQMKKLRLAELLIHSRNVQLDMAKLAEGKIQVIQSQTKFRAVITESDLTAMLAKGKRSAEMGLVVKYGKDAQHGDVLHVSGNWSWNWFSGPVTGVGKLRVSSDNKVYADIISLKLNGHEVPNFVKNKFSEKLNPVLDVADVPFQPRSLRVKVEGSRAILST